MNREGVDECNQRLAMLLLYHFRRAIFNSMESDLGFSGFHFGYLLQKQPQTERSNLNSHQDIHTHTHR